MSKIDTAALEQCRRARTDPNVSAFLRVLRSGESSQTPDAYRMMFGGSLVNSLADHPRTVQRLGGIASTAAGAYQFLQRTWDECVAALGLGDFGPEAQDLAAVYLIRRRGALADVLAGRIPDALSKCAAEWASLPGSPYGQPTISLQSALATYRQFGGLDRPTTGPAKTAPPTPPAAAPASSPQADYQAQEDAAAGTPAEYPTQEATMPLPAIAAALLPTLIEAIPKLGKLFGSGSAVAERNVAAAELALKVVQDATGTRNAQEAVETIKADPAAQQIAAKAIEARWLDLTESGGGGIEGARKADTAASAAGGLLHSPSFWIACLLLPLVYLLVLSLIGLVGTATWSDDVRAGLAGSLISAVIGGLVGYYYGQTTSRNRSPQ